ncbi:MAG: hypothetical protein A3F83_06595 [Candidatus Glassbacteria bacterium RIFCSPLOWO2_12_FULL_58_11]|uniref:Methyltransferase type 11 domain-containing protein n=1 Tax=Candidatus Glassbacteria bacterium RIFCSPLOWO2_12_FULL_58_11 TaxID=1817867 RepID=A0A1F5YRM6_9BACT|nr:MAG: hypothetical protein A3F83_06595 [Candidatus Glassbacteria bacterium RIFCSPLOWO2_12_FULL_58_11]
MSKPVIVNLGCGSRKAEGEIGVDRYPGSLADVRADLEQPLPFAGNSVDRVVASHVLEHVAGLVRLVEEVHRILAPGGRFQIEVPYFAHPDSFRDPTHLRFFTWASLDYFIEGRKPAEYTAVCFRYRGRELIFGPGLWGGVGRLVFNLSPRRYEKYYARRFPARVLRAELEAVKSSA